MRVHIAFGLVLIWIIAGLATAQTPEIQNYTDAKLRLMRATATEQNQAAMYEDIEVLRRILGRKLRELYVHPTAAHWSALAPTDDYAKLMDWIVDDRSKVGSKVGDVTPWKEERANVNRTWEKWFLGASLHASAFPLAAEGVYLKGQGVVFTLTLPPQGRVVHDPHSKQLVDVTACTKCHVDAAVTKIFEAAKTASVPGDEWAKIRNQVRGVKEEPKKPAVPKNKAPEVCGPGTVGEAVLRVLADHGQHFARLGDNESITVVITFRTTDQARLASDDSFWIDVGAPVQTGSDGQARRALFKTYVNDLDSHIHTNLFKTATGGTTDDEFLRRVYLDLTGLLPTPEEQLDFRANADPDKRNKLVDRLLTKPAPGTKEGADAKNPAPQDPFAASGPDREVLRDYVLLGDLHLKQGKPKEARDAYERGITLYESKWNWGKPEDLVAQKELYGKLAQVHVQLGDLEAAKKALEKALKVPEADPKQPKPAAPPPAPAAAPLPAKLVIAAPKKLLDQAGSGKITFEEFKQQASVEYLTFPVGEKK